MGKRIFVFLILVIAGIMVALGFTPGRGLMSAVAGEKGSDMVGAGKKVSIDYVLTIDGQKIDSSKQGEPLEYTQGRGQLIPGLEKELEGMKAGDKKSVNVSPEEGYGVRNEEAIKEIPRSDLPANLPLEPGKMLRVSTPEGQSFPAVIKEVKKDSVVLDFNHPLAGKELHFDVTVVSVQ